MTEAITVDMTCEWCGIKRQVTPIYPRSGAHFDDGPEYVLEPPCPGMVTTGPHGWQYLASEVPEEAWNELTPRCPFDGQDDYGSYPHDLVAARYKLVKANREIAELRRIIEEARALAGGAIQKHMGGD